MNDFEIAARGQRASLAAEFLAPVLDHHKQQYVERIIEIASGDLDPKSRSEKLTSLSIAFRVLGSISDGLNAAVEDGKMAQKNILNAEKVERMGAHKRRLFDIAPQR